jgi:hypothetical protein
MGFVFHFYILRSTSWIWTNPSIEALKFESPSKWNSIIWGLQFWTLPPRMLYWLWTRRRVVHQDMLLFKSPTEVVVEELGLLQSQIDSLKWDLRQFPSVFLQGWIRPTYLPPRHDQVDHHVVLLVTQLQDFIVKVAILSYSYGCLKMILSFIGLHGFSGPWVHAHSTHKAYMLSTFLIMYWLLRERQPM